MKGGGAIPPRGTKYTLNAVSKEDFRRDVLKSDTAVLELPQIELVMEMGTLGSMYTTVEGLLSKVCNRWCFGLGTTCCRSEQSKAMNSPRWLGAFRDAEYRSMWIFDHLVRTGVVHPRANGFAQTSK